MTVTTAIDDLDWAWLRPGPVRSHCDIPVGEVAWGTYATVDGVDVAGQELRVCGYVVATWPVRGGLGGLTGTAMVRVSMAEGRDPSEVTETVDVPPDAVLIACDPPAGWPSGERLPCRRMPLEDQILAAREVLGLDVTVTDNGFGMQLYQLPGLPPMVVSKAADHLLEAGFRGSLGLARPVFRKTLVADLAAAAGAPNAGPVHNGLLMRSASPEIGRPGRASARATAQRYAAGMPLVRRKRKLDVGWVWVCPVPTCMVMRDGWSTVRDAREAWFLHAAGHGGFEPAWPDDVLPPEEVDEYVAQRRIGTRRAGPPPARLDIIEPAGNDDWDDAVLGWKQAGLLTRDGPGRVQLLFPQGYTKAVGFRDLLSTIFGIPAGSAIVHTLTPIEAAALESEPVPEPEFPDDDVIVLPDDVAAFF
jgi:hypothetical protein